MPDRTSRVWIQSPAYDLPLIALAPLIGILISIVARTLGEGRLMALGFVEANFFVLGMPHYLSTYSFYLGQENQRHVMDKKLAFIFGPLIVGGAMLGSYALGLYFFVAILVDSWNTYHVSRQSVGILSVYRHRGGGDNRQEKGPALWMLVGSAVGLFTIALERQPVMRKIAAPVLPFLVNVVGPLLLIVAAFAAFRLIRLMRARSAGAAEWVFLASSLLLFVPYLLVHDFTLATSALLAGHYVQYLGLLWLLNRRKYAAAKGPLSQRILAVISRNRAVLASVLIGLVAVPFALDRYVHHRNWNAFHTVWLNGVVLLHFYLDGVFWAFKDPYTRRSLGPYLVSYDVPQPTRALAVTAS